MSLAGEVAQVFLGFSILIWAAYLYATRNK